jgi:hypothetical protein
MIPGKQSIRGSQDEAVVIGRIEEGTCAPMRRQIRYRGQKFFQGGAFPATGSENVFAVEPSEGLAG